MYTVIVVDDEIELRKAIIEKVDWNAAGFEVVGDAENGIEALEMVERLEPDLLITDIKMPLMSGLELAHEVREIRPATQMVILSGYDDFEYARTAIQYNVISYLLKPISSEQMVAELCKIKQEMDKRFEEMKNGGKSIEDNVKRLKITEFLLPLVLDNIDESPNEDALRVKAEELGLIDREERAHFGILICKFKNRDQKTVTNESHVGFVNAVLHKYMHAESFFISNRIISLVVLQEDNISEELRIPLNEIVQSAQRILGCLCTVGISRSFDKLSQCSTAYFEAITARRYTADGTGAVRFITDQEHNPPAVFDLAEKSVFSLEQLLKTGNEECIEIFMSRLFAEENDKNLSFMVTQILATVYRTVSSVSDKKALSELISQNPVYEKTAFYDYHENIRDDLTKLCLNARAIISRYQKHDSELLCDKALQIINEEYSNEELSLTDVSSRLNVSPNYLSALLKKNKKANFTALVTEKRMKTAADLLLCTSMKSLEIAQRCGYSDQHYFSYCFKKYYGVSPIKMRENDRGADDEQQ